MKRLGTIPRRMALLASAALLPGPGASGQESGNEGPAACAAIARGLVELESRTGPLGHAGVCRIEESLREPSLGTAWRSARIRCQKALVFAVWHAATLAARAQGEAVIDLATMSAALGLRVGPFEDVAEGRSVAVRGATPMILTRANLLSYENTGLALRAILAVLQDNLAAGGEELLPLSDAALARLASDVNTVTVASLVLASEAAGDRGEVDGAALADAWGRVESGASVDPVAEAQHVPATPGRALMREVLRGKQESLERHSGVGAEEREASLLDQARALAGAELPQDPAQAQALWLAYEGALVDFAVQVLRASEVVAERNGHGTIRYEDALRALQVVTPHVLEADGGVSFFPGLDPAAQMLLSAEDARLAREQGLQWKALLLALGRPDCPHKVPDPFAAEVLGEGIAHYAVLLWRMAGQLAGPRGPARPVTPKDVTRSVRRISNRAQQGR